MRGWSESVGGTPGAWGKKADSLMPALPLGSPTPYLGRGNPLHGRENSLLQPHTNSPSHSSRKPICTDHNPPCLSTSLHHIWAELHAHGGIRGHSKIIRRHHGSHLGLWGENRLVPGEERKTQVTDEGMRLPLLPAGQYQPLDPIHSPTLTFLQSS